MAGVPIQKGDDQRGRRGLCGRGPGCRTGGGLRGGDGWGRGVLGRGARTFLAGRAGCCARGAGRADPARLVPVPALREAVAGRPDACLVTLA